jgi:hypothetical protein
MPPSEFSSELCEQSSPELPKGSGIAAAATAVAARPGLPGSAAGRARNGWPGWGRPALLAAGGVVALDGLSHLIQPGAGLVLGVGVLAGGWWLLTPGARPLVRRQPASLKGWIERCEALLVQFNKLEPGAGQAARRAQLAELEHDRLAPELQLALVAVEAPAPEQAELPQQLAAALRIPHPLRLQIGLPLGSRAEGWSWPPGPAAADGLLFRIDPPLRASELRWLEAAPADQPIWLLVRAAAGADAEAIRADLQQQWPAADPERIVIWSGAAAELAPAIAPLSQWLSRGGPLLRSRSAKRRLQQLHGQWQAELERLRRREWLQIQQRTQWVVAAGVLVTPLPSLDLLVLAAANGLMLREMARLWDCPWTLDQLRVAAAELGRAALAQGVVEWSSQALAGAIKLHGATWLVGGALQALSAAYLTRVVGRAMADMLALSAGVSEPDLVRIRQEAPLLVARAAAEEKLDWAAFLGQGRRWIDQQRAPAAG